MASDGGREDTGVRRLQMGECHPQVHVTKGDEIPKYPNCGEYTYDTRYHETTRSSRTELFSAT